MVEIFRDIDAVAQYDLPEAVNGWLSENGFGCDAINLADKLVRMVRRNGIAHAISANSLAGQIALEPDANLQGILRTMYEKQH